MNVRGVVALAGITDLAAFAAPAGCGAAVPLLMGGTSADLPEVYSTRSPVSRPGARTAVALVTARDDRTVPQAQRDVYLARFPSTMVVTLPGGHFDLVAPWSEAWREILSLVCSLNP